MKMKKKYVFLDIDGTLLSGTALPPSALNALRRAKDNGHELVICTGRSRYEIFPFLLEAFDFDGVISSSGSRVERGDEMICHSITNGQAGELCGYFKERDIPYTVMTAEMTYYSFDEFSRIGGEIEQIDFYCGAEETEKLRERFGGSFSIVPGEITPKGISKASGIREYMELCGGIADTVAFGDSENDITMIEFAGVGIAMGNACDELKRAADLVTDCVDRDGLAKGFELLNLI